MNYLLKFFRYFLLIFLTHQLLIVQGFFVAGLVGWLCSCFSQEHFPSCSLTLFLHPDLLHLPRQPERGSLPGCTDFWNGPSNMFSGSYSLYFSLLHQQFAVFLSHQSFTVIQPSLFLETSLYCISLLCFLYHGKHLNRKQYLQY